MANAVPPGPASPVSAAKPALSMHSGQRPGSAVDGTGFPRDRILNAKLMHCKRVGDELFLRYRIQRGATKAR